MISTWRKSTHSQDTGGACVEVATADPVPAISTWRKSAYSDDTGGACVEVATADAVLIRDTTNRDGVTLNVSASAWLRFTSDIK
jgi:hypothetical protein